MSRPCLALLLLGLASPGIAQTPSPAPWTLASGDFTIYGHTDYVPIIRLLPRIVYDTGRSLDSARVVDSVRARRAGPGRPRRRAQHLARRAVLRGRRVGDGAAARSARAARAGPARLALRRAAGAGGAAPAAHRQPARPRACSRWTAPSGRTDRYAAVLTPDTLRKYRATLLGLNLADDYGCTRCWGGTVITQKQIAEWAAYARAKLPGLPLGVRRTPDWVAAYPALAPLLDYTWAQYHIEARRSGGVLRRRGGDRVAARPPGGDGGQRRTTATERATSPCDAATLARYGTLAVSHPATCAFLNWRYDEATWQQPEIRAAWDRLLALAKARPAQECRRVGGA